jgi:hypothetical protein
MSPGASHSSQDPPHPATDSMRPRLCPYYISRYIGHKGDIGPAMHNRSTHLNQITGHIDERITARTRRTNTARAPRSQERTQAASQASIQSQAQGALPLPEQPPLLDGQVRPLSPLQNSGPDLHLRRPASALRRTAAHAHRRDPSAHRGPHHLASFRRSHVETHQLGHHHEPTRNRRSGPAKPHLPARPASTRTRQLAPTQRHHTRILTPQRPR